VKSVELKKITDVENAADVIRDNGIVMMNDRDRVSRWQVWYSGCVGIR